MFFVLAPDGAGNGGKSGVMWHSKMQPHSLAPREPVHKTIYVIRIELYTHTRPSLASRQSTLPNTSIEVPVTFIRVDRSKESFTGSTT